MTKVTELAEKTEKTHPFIGIQKLEGKQATMGQMQSTINQILDKLHTLKSEPTD